MVGMYTLVWKPQCEGTSAILVIVIQEFWTSPRSTLFSSIGPVVFSTLYSLQHTLWLLLIRDPSQCMNIEYSIMNIDDCAYGKSCCQFASLKDIAIKTKDNKQYAFWQKFVTLDDQRLWVIMDKWDSSDSHWVACRELTPLQGRNTECIRSRALERRCLRAGTIHL